jgi:ketosteroid isomerase-like protein
MKPEEMLDRYVAAVRAKDVNAFLDLYADDTRNFDLWGVWSYDGKDALRPMVEGWFGSLPDDEAVTAFTTFAAETPDGTELRSMNNRLTWILRRDGDGWKIVHEHTSAPAGDEGKVSLRRS